MSKFLAPKISAVVSHASQYLESRGLTIEDVAVFDTSIQFGKEELDGWAFRIRDGLGEYKEGQYIFRPVPDHDPKFIQSAGHRIVHFENGYDRLANASCIMIHEKITSAAIARKALDSEELGVVAISGCYGWGRGGKLHPEIEQIVLNAKHNANIAVHFDGDIIENPDIQNSAGQLKGIIMGMRSDLHVTFPMVPPLRDNNPKRGWDDWAVEQGANLASSWVMVLEGEGVEVHETIPIRSLVQLYGLSIISSHKGAVQVEQSIDNMRRLMRHESWKDYREDTNGDLYHGMDYVGDVERVSTEFHCFVERSICRGYAAKVSASKTREAFNMEMRFRQCSIVVELLEAQPPVTEEEARAAAYKLITEGMRVTGPMTSEEMVETMLRVMRDLVLRWGLSRHVDVQWIFSILGPTGCGKSRFPEFLLSGLVDLGLNRPLTASLSKSGNRMTGAELTMMAEANLVVLADDYKPDEAGARQIENELFSLTTSRVNSLRKPYGRAPENVMLHAGFFLTTTDTNRQFLHSAAGSGERRFIPVEVEGTMIVGGRKLGNKEVIKECGLLLLRWAAHNPTYEGVATEYSERYIGEYLQEALAVTILSGNIHNWAQVREDLELYRREGVIRLTLPLLRNVLGVDTSRNTKSKLHDLTMHFEKCGARRIGQARVNSPDGGSIMKDVVYEIENLDAFIANLSAN